MLKFKNLTKKQPIIRVILIILAAVLLIHLGHAVTLDRIVQFKEVSFYSADLPPLLDGYRIAFVTDTHATSERRLRRITDEINDRSVDLLLLGGDFAGVRATGTEFGRCIEILSQSLTTDGIFGVDGNHDVSSYLFNEMRAHGINPLPNNGVHIRDRLFVCGVINPMNGFSDIESAVRAASPNDFVLLLAHDADITMQQSTSDVDLILSGHTHGGQATLFGLWAPAMNIVSRYGRRFMSGWATSRDDVPVFVSNGVGQYFPRVFARPQVIFLTLRAE